MRRWEGGQFAGWNGYRSTPGSRSAIGLSGHVSQRDGARRGDAILPPSTSTTSPARSAQCIITSSPFFFKTEASLSEAWIKYSVIIVLVTEEHAHERHFKGQCRLLVMAVLPGSASRLAGVCLGVPIRTMPYAHALLGDSTSPHEAV